MQTEVLRVLRAEARSWWRHRELRRTGGLDEARRLERQTIRRDLGYLRTKINNPNAYVNCSGGGTILHLGLTTVSLYVPVEHFPLASLAVRLGSDARGAWNWRMAYDMMQAAAVQTLFLDASGSGSLGAAKNLATRLLTETRRSEQQIRLQQFSTPLPYAVLAVRAAAIRNGEAALEPSAGAGSLAGLMKRAGAKLMLNEVDPFRQRLMARPRYRDALTASLRATAPALLGFQGLAFLRGGMVTYDFPLLTFLGFCRKVFAPWASWPCYARRMPPILKVSG